jgi:hypothetical protein
MSQPSADEQAEVRCESCGKLVASGSLIDRTLPLAEPVEGVLWLERPSICDTCNELSDDDLRTALKASPYADDWRAARTVDRKQARWSGS